MISAIHSPMVAKLGMVLGGCVGVRGQRFRPFVRLTVGFTWRYYTLPWPTTAQKGPPA